MDTHGYEWLLMGTPQPSSGQPTSYGHGGIPICGQTRWYPGPFLPCCLAMSDCSPTSSHNSYGDPVVSGSLGFHRVFIGFSHHHLGFHRVFIAFPQIFDGFPIGLLPKSPAVQHPQHLEMSTPRVVQLQVLG